MNKFIKLTQVNSNKIIIASDNINTVVDNRKERMISLKDRFTVIYVTEPLDYIFDKIDY